MGNVRHFRRIRKNDALFLKICVFREKLLNLCIFREHLVNLCAFRRNLVSSLENLQILPLGNVRIFRRIHKHDTFFSENVCFSVDI